MYHSRKKKKPFHVKKHFTRRCLERIGFPIDADKLKELRASNSLQFVYRQSNTRTHWLVPMSLLPKGFERELVAVYDSVRHEFVTVLYLCPEYNDFVMEEDE